MTTEATTDTTPPKAAYPVTPYEIVVTLDRVLHDRDMTVTELSRRTGISRTNLDKLKNGRATGVIWDTLGAICAALDCTPGDLLTARAAEPPQGHQAEES
jgi:putative transcriptional regulator